MRENSGILSYINGGIEITQGNNYKLAITPLVTIEMQKYEELPNILIWKSFNKGTLAKGLCDYIITNRNVHNTETEFIMKKLYYIDSVNSFPLEEFKTMIPINMPINKSIYDNVIINQALNLKELNEIVMKIIRTDKQRVVNEENIKQQTLKSPQITKDNILVIINGLDIMFQNSSMSDSRQAHNHLNTTLLQLRITANRRTKSFRSVILSRDPLNSGTSTQQFKKRARNEGNSVYQYVSKYYADYDL